MGTEGTCPLKHPGVSIRWIFFFLRRPYIKKSLKIQNSLYIAGCIARLKRCIVLLFLIHAFLLEIGPKIHKATVMKETEAAS